MKLKSVKLKPLLFHISLWLFTAGTVYSQSVGSTPTLSSYFDLLASGNYESAVYLWNSQAVERSSKFGIVYDNIPLKIDCSSPIVQNLSVMRDFLQPPVKRYEDIFDGKYQKLFYSAVVQGQKVEHIYYAEYDGKHYWLTYPQDIYAGEWPIRESEYFRIHAHPDVVKFLSRTMFSEADLFVERMADTLGISKLDLRHLQSTKIDFYYCASDSQVEQLTGRRTRGLYDKASSDIISSFFPHHHEVVHLLMDYKLRNAPLFIHPLFEEGVAVHYGGRWGKSTESLMPLGIFLYEQGLVELDSLLRYQTFKNSSEADISYPLAALFNRFIMEKVGREKYLALYRKFGGSSKMLSELPVDSVKARVLRSVSISDWDKFVAVFNDYLNSYKTKHYAALPGSTGHGETVVNAESVVVRSNEQWLEFEFVKGASAAPKGNLLFGKSESGLENGSAMFAEHYGDGIPFEGYRYGVRFDVNEAGLYDYSTNTLLAKYIAAVAPSDDYFDLANHKIAVRIKKSLTNGIIPSENDYKLLNN